MSSYGGNNYSKPAYGADGGDNAGGFFGGSQGGSQGGGKGFGEETLRPVTIKQLIDANQAYPDGPFRIDDLDVTQVTFVAMVRNVSMQTTNNTYQLDDGTGIIEVKEWIDADRNNDDEREKKPPYDMMEYVRVFGRLKSFNNKRHVGAHSLRAVADYNEVSYHLLEVTYVHLAFTKGSGGGGGGAGHGDGNAGDDDSMFVDGGSESKEKPSELADKLRHVSQRAQRFFNFLNVNNNGSEGVHVSDIAKGCGMMINDAMAASEELIGPGMIYTTTDDETFAVLDY
ncbi:putative replication factor-a protein [Pestalotiopsis sp. NC0098]|nr:putative replication factor-a protein [Pestalotiopsis sp. NC0098]